MDALAAEFCSTDALHGVIAEVDTKLEEHKLAVDQALHDMRT